MLKRTIVYTLSAISFLNLVILPDVYAEDQKAIWLEVTAEGVPGSAPNQNWLKITLYQKCSKKHSPHYQSLVSLA